MAGDSGNSSDTYTRVVGFIYVFNLIVGTGALTMPKAFQESGWLLSGIVIVILAFMSYMTATFVIEAMSISNALDKKQRYDETKPSLRHADMTDSSGLVESLHTIQGSSPAFDDESTPLLYQDPRMSPIHQQSIQGDTDDNSNDPANLPLHLPANESFFEITDKFELGQMASNLFNRVGIVLFYLSMCIYLYGDLAVYAASVPKSLRDVACTYVPSGDNDTNWEENSPLSNISYTDNDPCWEGSSITRMNAYRIFLTCFAVCLCPFVFFNVSKTKLLQLGTSAMRWLAFTVILVLTSIRLAQGKGQGHPPVLNVASTPNLFGICVYAFMCHHSLPSLVSPIRRKRHLTRLLFFDYLLILVFYLCLSYTAIYAFAHIADLYTLDFEPRPPPESGPPITNIAVFQYYLALFPVFTLSTNFPIIGITLRNTLESLFLGCIPPQRLPWQVRRFCFPLFAVLPPIAIAMATNNLSMLVGVTGSYAGAAIQYLIPAFLVYYARKACLGQFPQQARYDRRYVQIHRSPFAHRGWLAVVLVWAVISVTLVTVNHFIDI